MGTSCRCFWYRAYDIYLAGGRFFAKKIPVKPTGERRPNQEPRIHPDAREGKVSGILMITGVQGNTAGTAGMAKQYKAKQKAS